MGKLYSSRFVEANPRYREALRLKQERERAADRSNEEAARKRTRDAQLRSTAQCNEPDKSEPATSVHEEPTVAAIIVAVAHRYKLTADDLTGFSRKRRVVEARYDALAEIYTRIPSMALAKIGAEFGGRDERTIANAVKTRGVEKRKVRISPHRPNILKLYDDGRSVKDIAFKLGCPASTVFGILRRERQKPESGKDTAIR